VSCSKAQEVLGAEHGSQTDIHDARKEKIDETKAWDRIKGCEHVVIAKGKKMVALTPSPENKKEILTLAMGRSGSLRAPSVLVEKTLLIGFNEPMYARYVK